jgi:VIT1/CCC1 family predicted Fe2+/Mn2+ transporter
MHDRKARSRRETGSLIVEENTHSARKTVLQSGASFITLHFLLVIPIFPGMNYWSFSLFVTVSILYVYNLKY